MEINKTMNLTETISLYLEKGFSYPSLISPDELSIKKKTPRKVKIREYYYGKLTGRMGILSNTKIVFIPGFLSNSFY